MGEKKGKGRGEGETKESLKSDVASQLRQLGLAAGGSGAQDHAFADFAPPVPKQKKGTSADHGAPKASTGSEKKQAAPSFAKQQQQQQQQRISKGKQHGQEGKPPPGPGQEEGKRDWNAGAGPRPGMCACR